MSTLPSDVRPSIRIRQVPALAGLQWIRLAWRAFLKQPGGFLGLFGLFLLCTILLSLPLAVVGVPLAQALGVDGPLALAPFSLLPMPLLSLGFMLATQAVGNDLRVRLQHLFLPLQAPGATRRSLALLGLAYVALPYIAYFLGNGLDHGEVRDWIHARLVPPVDAAAAAALGAPPPDDLAARIVLMLKMGAVALGSVPLWHAPALVLWGRQGVRQAMFASVVALWRTRGACTVFGLGWFALAFFASSLLALAEVLLPEAAGVAVALGVSWVMSALFYVTLWFGFEDTFDISRPRADA